MTVLKYKKTIFVLSLAGVLFSGYLSAVKLFTSVCALREPCPYFLDKPACWFGFAMFLMLFISAVLAYSRRVVMKKVAIAQAAVSALGVIFAGSFAIPEVGKVFSNNAVYSLGLSTCTYGFIFFAIIFVLSAKYVAVSKA